MRKVLLLLVCLGLALLSSNLSTAAEPLTFPAGRDHLWNRLHDHFYVRIKADGSRYVHENLEANFTPRANFLLEGESHRQAIALLDEFLRPEAVRLEEPRARAILQRDLWAVFAAITEPDLPGQEARKELQQRLAKVMRRIALPAEEIAKLPDNLGAVVQRQRDPEEVLPRDLFSADGPWVLLSNRFRDDKSPAPQHDKATHGRSTFLMLLRLPAGRQATLDYLKDLGQKELGRDELPQFPTGTQVALVRRTNLLDQEGRVQISPLTESVQVRVYADLKRPQMFEFNLRRLELLREPADSLQPVLREEVNPFDLGLLGLAPRSQQDPIENPLADSTSRDLGHFVMKSCVRCHAGPGIFGFQSLFVDHFDQPPLVAGKIDEQLTASQRWAEKAASVVVLQKLWAAK